MSQLLTIVLERQNYVEASSAHYPWKWRLTNHGIHHVLTPWQYFHVSMMSEWLRQVAGWKIRPYLSGHHWFLAVDTEKQFPSFQSMENEPSSLKVMISASPEGRVIEWREQHLLRDSFQPFLSACLEMGRKSLFANISLLSTAQIHFIQARDKSRCHSSSSCFELQPGKALENKLLTSEVWQVKFQAFHEGCVHLNPTSGTGTRWASASL